MENKVLNLEVINLSHIPHYLQCGEGTGGTLQLVVTEGKGGNMTL